jgi:hypothetical protein
MERVEGGSFDESTPSGAARCVWAGVRAESRPAPGRPGDPWPAPGRTELAWGRVTAAATRLGYESASAAWSESIAAA